ncbi:hypothetical protein CYLTODRAFT_444010 [Cylindrobasidium torrendii FP15055 ss-10]|uniref:Uncharacterized protein n=1 Tax=Cylindrobasidium torrendii FP15055 ss-10 TaxID=1314674 RepID=A0A0D7BB51_9AGAR|nr:hypothetical protein CYLTODRAFT_444010 [Cylindrobasidium torrendii FP15055 ss-10]
MPVEYKNTRAYNPQDDQRRGWLGGWWTSGQSQADRENVASYRSSRSGTPNTSRSNSPSITHKPTAERRRSGLSDSPDNNPALAYLVEGRASTPGLGYETVMEEADRWLEEVRYWAVVLEQRREAWQTIKIPPSPSARDI